MNWRHFERKQKGFYKQVDEFKLTKLNHLDIQGGGKKKERYKTIIIAQMVD
jgi:hypothetical protein